MMFMKSKYLPSNTMLFNFDREMTTTETHLEILAISYETLADCSADETATDNRRFLLSSLDCE